MSHNVRSAVSVTPVTSAPPATLVTDIAVNRRLKKSEVCSLLGISPRTLDNLVNRRQFPEGVRIGKWTYWSVTAVERFHARAFAAQENWTPPQATVRARARKQS